MIYKNKKKIAAAFIVAVLSLIFTVSAAVYITAAPLVIWNGSVAAGYAGGDGSEASPYLIENGEQLAFLAQKVNSGTTYAGVYFKLEKDICLNDFPAALIPSDIGENVNVWTPIGNVSRSFRGVFNGNGHAVSGVYVNQDAGNAGLFGNTLNASVINLTVSNSYIRSYGENAAIVGKFMADKATGVCRLSGCRVTGSSITNSANGTMSTGSVAGIVNLYNASVVEISDCSASMCAVTSYGSYVGGVFGRIQASQGSSVSVTGCRSSGIITCDKAGSTNVGGVFGDISVTASTANAELCASDMNIKAAGSYIGGLIGGIGSNSGGLTSVKKSYSSGAVDCKSSNVGGISGSITAKGTSSHSILSDCFSTCEINNTGNSNGGIAGTITATGGTAEAVRCYTVGTLNGGANNGGTVGTIQIGGSTSSSTASYSACFYHFNIGGRSYGYSNNIPLTSLTGGLQKRASELSRASTFETYDFNNVWEIKSSSVYKYPTIRGLSYAGTHVTPAEYKITVEYRDAAGGKMLDDNVIPAETGEKYTITAANIAKFSPDRASFTGVMQSTNIKVRFVYTQTEFPPHKLTVRYLYSDGSPAHAASETYVNEYASYEVKSPEITGYTPDKAKVSGRISTEDIEFTVTYSINSYTLRVEYLMPDGKPAGDTYNVKTEYNAPYSITSPVITGYETELAQVSGTMPANDLTVTVNYRKQQFTLSVIYEYADGLNAAEEYNGTFKYLSDYSVTSPEIARYSASVAVVSGTITENTVVKVIYTAIPKKSVVPDKPTVDSSGTDYVVILPVTVPEGAEVLYGIGTSDNPESIVRWGTALRFDGLEPGSVYYIFSVISENPDYLRKFSAPAQVTLERLSRTVTIKEIIGINDKGFSVSYRVVCEKDYADTADGNIEYGISASPDISGVTTWQSSDSFNGLAADTQYYCFVRITGSAKYHDAVSEAKPVRTTSVPETTAEVTSAPSGTTEEPTGTGAEPTGTGAETGTGNETTGGNIPGGSDERFPTFTVIVIAVILVSAATAVYFIIKNKRNKNE